MGLRFEVVMGVGGERTSGRGGACNPIENYASRTAEVRAMNATIDMPCMLHPEISEKETLHGLPTTRSVSPAPNTLLATPGDCDPNDASMSNLF